MTMADEVQWFLDDDEAYLAWIQDNPQGYVVNCHRSPNPSYLKLHRATCGTMSDRPARGDTWTCGDYAKACAGDTVQLNRWALRETGGLPTLCELCRP